MNDIILISIGTSHNTAIFVGEEVIATGAHKKMHANARKNYGSYKFGYVGTLPSNCVNDDFSINWANIYAYAVEFNHISQSA